MCIYTVKKQILKKNPRRGGVYGVKDNAKTNKDLGM